MTDFVASFAQKTMFEGDGQKIEMIEIEKIIPDSQQVRQYFDDEKLKELAAHASVPVINGLTEFSHPCQILADILTFEYVS